jgi:polyhydroxyalkanoate synthase
VAGHDGAGQRLLTNPVVLKDALESGGAHLVQGAMNWLHDVSGLPDAGSRPKRALRGRPRRGRDAGPGGAAQPPDRADPLRAADAKVHPEPVLIVPSWIMKYYILDLSPHNSMVRYLVEPGPHGVHAVLAQPRRPDRDLTMDDYLRLGVLDALARGRPLHGDAAAQPVHAMGYCLGGTLLAIAAAALARDGGADAATDLPPLASLTLLAAQTDFSEPGELGLFIDESQVGYLDEITAARAS